MVAPLAASAAGPSPPPPGGGCAPDARQLGGGGEGFQTKFSAVHGTGYGFAVTLCMSAGVPNSPYISGFTQGLLVPFCVQFWTTFVRNRSNRLPGGNGFVWGWKP